jgi:hypothetical protein
VRVATEVLVDYESGVQVWNEAGPGVNRDSLMGELRRNPMIASLTKWTLNTQGGSSGRRGYGVAGLFDRDRYVVPDSIYEQFRVAQDAVENDDVVGGWMDTTEQLAFSDVQFACGDREQQDVWNQIGIGMGLTEAMRRCWRGYSTMSQVYPCVWWANRDFKVGTKTPGGKASKKVFQRVKVPVAVTHLDPQKVLPVGNLMFGQEQLAYVADTLEVDALDAACNGEAGADEMARAMIVGKYEPANDWERRQIEGLGQPLSRLYLLNPDMIWRYTATRMEYERFASVRLKPVLELLDAKHQLRQSDRAALIGASNFILLVRQGSDRLPAKQPEIDALNAQMQTIGRVPMMVGDHRLSVDIITPKTDHTLDGDKHATINAYITAYLYKMFMLSHMSGGRSDDQVKVAKIVGAGLQASRKRQGDSWHAHLIARAMRLNDAFTDEPSIKFTPRRIQLDFDQALAQLLLDIYDRGDASRGTILDLVGLDQAEEAEKKKLEEEEYDDIFKTQVPFTGGPAVPGDAGAPVDPRAAGRRQGGNRNGGGADPGSGQGKEPRDPRPTPKQRRSGDE